MLTSSTQLQNKSFHVVERTRTSTKCQKMKNTRAKRAKILFFIVKYANLWGFSCRRRRGCLSSLIASIERAIGFPAFTFTNTPIKWNPLKLFSWSFTLSPLNYRFISKKSVYWRACWDLEVSNRILVSHDICWSIDGSFKVKFQVLTNSTTCKRNLNRALIQSTYFLFPMELWQSIASLAFASLPFGNTSNLLLSSLCAILVG